MSWRKNMGVLRNDSQRLEHHAFIQSYASIHDNCGLSDIDVTVGYVGVRFV
jgi:hypothetical protein